MPPTAGCGLTEAARLSALLGVLAVALACGTPETPGGSDTPTVLDPSAWGDDHVGQPVPEYITGGECLFCHRDEASNTWGVNPHHLTIQEAAGGDVELVLGAGDQARFLKRIGYGKVALLRGTSWDEERFETSCAGCHTTAVDPETLAFSSPSLDCYVCHGNVDLEHSAEPERMLLSEAREDHARVVISICAQCHIRSGRSRSSGLPYPNNFVPGDNLFRDFEVDFSDEALEGLSLADRHVLENVRDVVLRGNDQVTCLSCHDVHASSHTRHEDVWQSQSCFTCHVPGREKSEQFPFTTGSVTCDRL